LSGKGALEQEVTRVTGRPSRGVDHGIS